MKKLVSVILAFVLVFSAAALVSCTKGTENAGENTTTAAENADEIKAAEEGGETESETEADNVIRIGASSTPHAEILEQVKDTLAEQGYTLDIVVYDDYILPNKGVTDGELDANYFQHTPYLNSYNASNGTDIVSAGLVHYEPFGLYGNGVAAVADIAEGATIIIPADDSNETRALFLLQQEGLITLPEDASAEAGVTTLDIVEDNGYNITAVSAETVAAQLENSDEGTVAVINGNYAIGAGLKIADALATEDASGAAAQTYANIVAVANGNENAPKITALVAALQSEAVAQYMEETYNGAVVAIH